MKKVLLIALLNMLAFSQVTYCKIIEYNKGNDTVELYKTLTQNKKIIVEFYSPTCEPCKRMSVTLNEIQDKIKYDIIKINYRKYDNISELYDIDSVPRIIVFENGKPTKQIRGAWDGKYLIENLK